MKILFALLDNFFFLSFFFALSPTTTKLTQAHAESLHFSVFLIHSPLVVVRWLSRWNGATAKRGMRKKLPPHTTHILLSRARVQFYNNDDDQRSVSSGWLAFALDFLFLWFVIFLSQGEKLPKKLKKNQHKKLSIVLLLQLNSPFSYRVDRPIRIINYFIFLFLCNSSRLSAWSNSTRTPTRPQHSIHHTTKQNKKNYFLFYFSDRCKYVFSCLQIIWKTNARDESEFWLRTAWRKCTLFTVMNCPMPLFSLARCVPRKTLFGRVKSSRSRLQSVWSGKEILIEFYETRSMQLVVRGEASLLWKRMPTSTLNFSFADVTMMLLSLSRWQFSSSWMCDRQQRWDELAPLWGRTTLLAEFKFFHTVSRESQAKLREKPVKKFDFQTLRLSFSLALC